MLVKVLIGIVAVIVAFNGLVAYSCCVVGARADRQMAKLMESEEAQYG